MIEGLRLEGFSLTVEDVERSLAFYRDKLKLDVIYESLPAFALVRLGAATIGLLSAEAAAKNGVAPSTPAQRRGFHIEFTTDDLDGLYATLQANGVDFAQPPHEEPWERAMSTFDPDGYVVEFAQGRRGARVRIP